MSQIPADVYLESLYVLVTYGYGDGSPSIAYGPYLRKEVAEAAQEQAEAQPLRTWGSSAPTTS